MARELLAGERYGAMHHDLEWRLAETGDRSCALVYIAHDQSAPRAYAAFFKQARPLKFLLGEFTIASARVDRYTLAGEPIIPTQDRKAAAEAIASLLNALKHRIGPRDAIYFEGLPLDGPTYSAITANPAVRQEFVVLQLGVPFDHQFIDLPRTYDEYLKQLGARSRQSLQYSERKLARDMGGQVTLRRFDQAESVAQFLTDATVVSRKTYQWNVLGLGLRDTQGLKGQLLLAAMRGWLRSYILYCKEMPVAFMLGYQYHGACYYYMDVGYDPEYASWSVGSVLQLKVLQDLYAQSDRPEVFDFSIGQGDHKRRFGNRSRREANVLLLPNTVRSRVLAFTFNSWDRATAGAVSLLDHLGVKSRLKTLIRRSWKR
jgi:hypothetical protein